MRVFSKIAGVGFVFCAMVLILSGCLVALGQAAEVPRSKALPADDAGAAAKQLTSPGIPCDWKGWKPSYQEAKCTMTCDRYVEVLRMECSDGIITGAKMGTICVACPPPLSP